MPDDRLSSRGIAMTCRVAGVGFVLAVAGLAGCAFTPPAVMSGTTTAFAVAPGSIHQQVFNQGWLFAKEDVAGAEAADFNDASWRRLDLPHDWSIEGPFDPTLAACTGYLPGGIAWYRKHFTLTPQQKGKNVAIRFDGVYKNSTVYLNGHKLGDRPNGYISFDYDLTPFLNQTGDNVLAVRVDHHDFADSRWYPGSGIYRNVYLTATDAVHFDRYGVFVTTPDVSATSSTVAMEFAISNAHQGTSVTLSTQILDSQDREVARTSTSVVPGRIGPGFVQLPGPIRTVQALKVSNPKLWSLDSPTIYTAISELRDQSGHLLDSYRTPFGIRTFRFDATAGFSLNGTPMKLKGVCLHHDAGGLGAAVPRQVWERRLMILKSAGANAIRTSHNPPAPEFLDLCDRMGFLVIDEAFDEWSRPKKKWIDTWSGKNPGFDGYAADFEKWADTDLKDMVLRDRNHPSIIMWSIGNEVDYLNDPYPANSEELAAIAPRLIRDVKQLDTTRPVTAACAAIATNAWYKQLDIVGYNYQESRYRQDHAAGPNRVIFGSENGMDLAAWNAVADNPFIAGQFLWTGIDYLGEAGRSGARTAWPERARPDGLLDLAAFKKPAFHFRKSLWTDPPMVKIDDPLPAQRPTPGLACYTNCDTVEFFQNDRSLGVSPLPRNTRILRVPADPAAGPIRAVGLRGGQTAAEDTFSLSGPPTRISLSEFKTTLGPGDGPNVAQLELSLLDSDFRLARDATNEITVQLDGPGRILALESGDKDSHESYQSPTRKAFHGRLLLVIETHGLVTVTATAPGVTTGQIEVGH
jgi:beta-galactosidase